MGWALARSARLGKQARLRLARRRGVVRQHLGASWDALHRELFVRPAGNLAALDGIRALAAIAIVCYHASIWTALGVRPEMIGTLPAIRSFGFGWIGVDVFFVLSGFLIGRILILHHTSLGSLKRFYLRRVCRIFPAYYVVLTLTLLIFSRLDVFRLLFHAQAWSQLAHRSWANYLYVSNYAYGHRGPNLMDWGWSLCIEEHFYLVFPLVLIWLNALDKRGRLFALTALVLVPSVLRIVALSMHPGMNALYGVYDSSHTHCDGLLLGVLVAHVYVHYRAPLARVLAAWPSLPAVLAVACFAVAVRWGGLLQGGLGPVGFQFLMLALAAGAVVVNGLMVDNALSRFLRLGIWYPIARVSYGLYLIHLFPLFLLRWAWPSAPATSLLSFSLFLLTVLAISLLCAVALFFAVERPALRWGAMRWAAVPVLTEQRVADTGATS